MMQAEVLLLLSPFRFLLDRSAPAIECRSVLSGYRRKLSRSSSNDPDPAQHCDLDPSGPRLVLRRFRKTAIRSTCRPQIKFRNDSLLVFMDETGHETFAGDHSYFAVGGCAMLGAHHAAIDTMSLQEIANLSRLAMCALASRTCEPTWGLHTTRHLVLPTARPPLIASSESSYLDDLQDYG
jgi:hypothetical protein